MSYGGGTGGKQYDKAYTDGTGNNAYWRDPNGQRSSSPTGFAVVAASAVNMQKDEKNVLHRSRRPSMQAAAIQIRQQQQQVKQQGNSGNSNSAISLYEDWMEPGGGWSDATPNTSPQPSPVQREPPKAKKTQPPRKPKSKYSYFVEYSQDVYDDEGNLIRKAADTDEDEKENDKPPKDNESVDSDGPAALYGGRTSQNSNDMDDLDDSDDDQGEREVVGHKNSDTLSTRSEPIVEPDDDFEDGYRDAVSIVVRPPTAQKVSSGSQTPQPPRRRRTPRREKSDASTQARPRRSVSFSSGSSSGGVKPPPPKQRNRSKSPVSNDGYLPTRASELRAGAGVRRKESFSDPPKRKKRPTVSRSPSKRRVAPLPKPMQPPPLPKKEKIKIKKAGTEKTKMRPVKAGEPSTTKAPPKGWQPWSAVPRQFTQKDRFISSDG